MYAATRVIVGCTVVAAVVGVSGSSIDYRVERRGPDAAALAARFSPAQLQILEKLNRADLDRLPRLAMLVVPTMWSDELDYSPFPAAYPAAAHLPKILIVQQPIQAFAAYERGTLVRWGPISSGARATPTPHGWYQLNWRSRGRYSTIDPTWYMEWYFNFDNRLGLSLHQYALPGLPASHGCIRLLERDARWLYDWGEAGTPLAVAGAYDFAAAPPWRDLERLARRVVLPTLPPALLAPSAP